MIWCETSEPNLAEARRFAEAIHAQYPGKLLAYNCSPSFHWKKKLDDTTIAKFPERTGRHGLQVPVRDSGRIPCAEPEHVRVGAKNMPQAAWRLTPSYRSWSLRARMRMAIPRSSTRPSSAPVTSTSVAQTISGGKSSTIALKGSTEEAQFTFVPGGKCAAGEIPPCGMEGQC